MQRWRGFLYAVTAGTLFGVGGTFGQFLFQQHGVNVEWLVTVRMLSSGCLLWLLSAARDSNGLWAVWRRRADAARLLVFGICGMLAVQYTYFAAIAASNTATATVLQYTSPVMIAVWLVMRGRRWPSTFEYAAIVLALAGTFFLVTHGALGALSISALALFWGIASAVAAAVNSLQPIGLLHRYKASHITAWGMLIGGTALACIHPPWNVTGTWDVEAVLFMAFIITFGTLLAFYLYLQAIKLIGAQRTSLLCCAEPLAAAVLAVWWLKVPFGAMDWLGTVCILATIFVLARDKPAEPVAGDGIPAP